MKIIISSIQVPFINGGAEIHITNLKVALERYGHEVEIVSFPFNFSPEDFIGDLMEHCARQDFSDYDADKVISLQFPAYYVQHYNKTIWVMHQFRGVYDLYDEKRSTKKLQVLKKKIEEMDSDHLDTRNTIYANSNNVAKRLKYFNRIESEPLYHPPANENYFYCDTSYGFIFYPSRLERLKRQDLLIEAMQYTTSKAVAIIAGDGGEVEVYRQMITALSVSDKVSLIGYISDEEKYTLYARSLAVFFAPYGEDYGYVTLEAMLSSKPVITCTDSGGPLEFVIDDETGFIVRPDPKIIAQKIDWLYENQQKAQILGENGLENYRCKDISWDNVVQKLLDN